MKARYRIVMVFWSGKVKSGKRQDEEVKARCICHYSWPRKVKRGRGGVGEVR